MDPPAIAVVVVGFLLAYLGLGTITAHGTDLVVRSAPAAKTLSAAAMSETVQDLAVSLGITLLGSLTSVIYQHNMALHTPNNLPETTQAAVTDSLYVAAAIASDLPPGLFHGASAFNSGVVSGPEHLLPQGISGRSGEPYVMGLALN